jgi:hypothetical protein
MQPVLVDGRQFMPERLVEVIDDAGLALHFLTPALILVSEPRSAGALIITIPLSAQRTIGRRREPVPCFVKSAMAAI